MKRLLVTLICVLSLSLLISACSGGGNIDKLNGKWTGDAAETMKLSGQSADSELELQMAEMIFGAISMTVDAKAKKIIFSMGGEKEEIDFKVFSDSGKTVVLESADQDKITFEFAGDDLVLMRDDSAPDKSMAFRRVKQ